jgi:thiol-disulfide isomerase/thioredoxin
VAHAPDVQADGEQQQWWHDPGAWQELKDPAELEAFLKGSSSGGRLKAVEFYATWCPACKAAAPEMAAAAADPALTASTTFARANVDRVRPVLKQFQVTTIPTVVLFNSEGLPLDAFHASAAAVRAAIQQHASAPVSPAAPAATGAGPVQQALLAEAPSTSSSASSHKSAGAVCTTPDIPCDLPAGGSSNSSTSAPAASSSNPALAARHNDDLEAAKAAFLQAAGPAYGYGGWLDAQYDGEVGSRLGPGQHYLDYTGEMVTQLQVQAVCWLRIHA